MTSNEPSTKPPTIISLVSSLTIPQLWALIIAIGGLLCGTFEAGSLWSIHQSQGEIDECRADKPKAEFLARALRYADVIKEQPISPLGTSEPTFESLVDLVDEWWTRQSSSPTLLAFGAPRITKGEDLTQSFVRFADGTTWRVPPEIKREVLNREFRKNRHEIKPAGSG